MVENGSSGGARPLPSSESHDEFLELCALSTTNALSPEEKERLERHLIGCTECRDALEQYRALVDAQIPAACSSLPSDPDWSIEEAEVRLLARLETEEIAAENGLPGTISTPSFSDPQTTGTSPRLDSLWRHMGLQFAAALLLIVALGYTVYRFGVHRGTGAALRAASTEGPASTPLAHTSSDYGSGAELARAEAVVQHDKAQFAAFDDQLRKQTAEITRLEGENRQAQSDLSAALAKQASLEQAGDNLARQLAEAQATVDQARQRLADLSAENAGDGVKVVALQRQIEDLNGSLAARDQDLARAQSLLDHDRDIRDLMGSRNLYIAEVYDVAKNGQTNKPFGRVFYTKGRSLIFYAYDLDQQPGVRDSSTFQAWGSRGQDRKDAVSLGIFYQDGAGKKRWILKAENPRVLSGIDAVFVTVEPRGGSTHPSGKPLLNAYLRIEPNHP
jgi:hypothetical protein